MRRRNLFRLAAGASAVLCAEMSGVLSLYLASHSLAAEYVPMTKRASNGAYDSDAERRRSASKLLWVSGLASLVSPFCLVFLSKSEAVLIGSVFAIAPTLFVLVGCFWRGLSSGPQDVHGSEGDGLVPYAAALILLFGCFQVFVLLPVRVQVFQQTKTAAENYVPPTITVTFTPTTAVTTNRSDVQGNGVGHN